MLRAWRYRHRLRDRAQMEAWLAKIVRNEAARRYARPEPELIDAPDIAEGWDEAGLLTRLEVELALKGLADEERELLDLRYRDDLTQSAIARRLGIPEGTVKVRLHRARAKLRDALG